MVDSTRSNPVLSNETIRILNFPSVESYDKKKSAENCRNVYVPKRE